MSSGSRGEEQEEEQEEEAQDQRKLRSSIVCSRVHLILVFSSRTLMRASGRQTEDEERSRKGVEPSEVRLDPPSNSVLCISKLAPLRSASSALFSA